MLFLGRLERKSVFCFAGFAGAYYIRPVCHRMNRIAHTKQSVATMMINCAIFSGSCKSPLELRAYKAHRIQSFSAQ